MNLNIFTQVEFSPYVKVYFMYDKDRSMFFGISEEGIAARFGKCLAL